MPRKKEGGRLPSQIFADLWDAIPWLDLANEARPDHRFMRTGPHIKGLCLYHEESGASFQITPSKRMAKCFGCGKFICNPVQLTQHMLRCSYAQALGYLKGLPSARKLLPAAFIEQNEVFEKHQQLKNEVVEFCCALLFKLMTCSREELANNWPWAMESVEWLQSRIQIDNTFPVLTANHLVGILPPMNVFEQDPEFCVKEEALKFAQTYLGEYIMQNYQHIGSVMLMTHLEPNAIGRIKLRKKGTSPIFIKDDHVREDQLGFFGMRYYRQYFGSNGVSIAESAYIHEGEFDAMHATANHIATGDDFIALAAGGGAASSADPLHAFGIKNIYIIPDDDKGGIHFTQHILGKTRSKDLTLKIFEWPQKYRLWSNPANPEDRVKDPDEAIRAFGYSAWVADVQNAANYREPHEWAMAQFERAARSLTEGDLAEHSRLAKEWGRYLNNQQECRAYCRHVAKNYDLDENILYREISAANEDEQGFIDRIKDALLGVYSVRGFLQGQNTLYLWHIKNRHLVQLQMDKPTALEARLAADVGPPHQFIREHVGDPSFLSDEDQPSTLSLRGLNQRYLDYIRLALLQIMQSAGPLDEKAQRRQGFHFIAGDDGQDRGYLLNGADLWRLTYSDDDMTVEALPALRDGSLSFEGDDSQRWLPKVSKASDIIDAEIDLRATHDLLHSIVRECWRFEQHDVDSQFLAAYLMTLPIADVFSRQTSIWLTGNAGSGKSRFIGGLISGMSFKDMQLIAAAHGMGNYTAAGIRQSCAGFTFVLALDEFEDDGSLDRRAREIKAILKMFNDQMTSHAGGKSTIGSQSGRAREVGLRFPAVIAAINPIQDEAAMSRFIVFKMAKARGEQVPDPRLTLFSKWGRDTVTELRERLGVGLFRHAPAIRRAYQAIELELQDSKALPATVPTRFKESLCSILAIRRVAGLEYLEFARSFAASRGVDIGRAALAGAGQPLFDDLLDAPFTLSGEHKESTSIRRMLSKVDELDAINRLHYGFYLDVTKRWLVVLWASALPILFRTGRNREKTPMDMLMRAERAPQHVSNEDVQRFKVLERLAPCMGWGVTHEMVSVFDVGTIIERGMQEDAARRQAMPAKDKEKPRPTVALQTAENVEAEDGEGV